MFLAASERALELVPAHPPSRQRAQALAGHASGLHLLWRYEESLALGEQALALARAVGAREAGVPGAQQCSAAASPILAAATRVSRSSSRPWGSPRSSETHRLCIGRTSHSPTCSRCLAGLPRRRGSGRKGSRRCARTRRTAPCCPRTGSRPCSRSGSGTWADHASATALRVISANYPHMPLMLRAELEVGRGQFAAARAHLDAARSTVRHEPGLATYDGYVAELALWERRWTDADAAIRDGMASARPRWGAQIRVWLCAKGLRAQAELAALARARHDADALRGALTHAADLLDGARRAAASPPRSPRTPLAGARWPRPSTSARGVLPGPTCGPAPRRRGTSSSDGRSPPTAAGARPRRSSAPARRAPRRALRSERRMRSRLVSERSPSPKSSSVSPNGHGSISCRPTRDLRTASKTSRRSLA